MIIIKYGEIRFAAYSCWLWVISLVIPRQLNESCGDRNSFADRLPVCFLLIHALIVSRISKTPASLAIQKSSAVRQLTFDFPAVS